MNNFLSWWNYSQLRFNWTKNTIYIYIYIYVYIYLWPQVSYFRHLSVKIFTKKKRLIWSFFFCVSGVERRVLLVCMCTKVCVRLNVSVFVYVLLLAHTYIRISAYLMECIFIYIYIYIYTYFRCLLVRRGKANEESMNSFYHSCLIHSSLFSLSLFLYIYIYIYHRRAASTDLLHSLAICFYHTSLLTGLLDNILYPYKVVVDRF